MYMQINSYTYISMYVCVLHLSKATNDEIKKNKFPIASSRMFICLWKYSSMYICISLHDRASVQRNITTLSVYFVWHSIPLPRIQQGIECPKTTANQSKFTRDDLPWNFWSMYNTPIFQLRQIDLMRGRRCLTTAFKYVPASAAAAAGKHY